MKHHHRQARSELDEICEAVLEHQFNEFSNGPQAGQLLPSVPGAKIQSLADQLGLPYVVVERRFDSKIEQLNQQLKSAKNSAHK